VRRFIHEGIEAGGEAYTRKCEEEEKRRKNVTLKTKKKSNSCDRHFHFFIPFSYIAHSQSELELPRKKSYYC
jgi:hypothetical protein